MSSDSAKSHWWDDPAKRAVRLAIIGAVLAAVPVVLVNSVAFIGQFAYLNASVPWPVPARVLIAVTIESIAVYLAWHAHLAKMANDTAMRLVLGAYAVALLIATVNYSHFAHDWHPTPLAVIMGLASLISPFLWGVHTKRASRDKLMERGLVEEHSVRLGGARWTWHPIRSVRATSWAAWHGENDPKIVLAHFVPLYGTAGTPAVSRKSVSSGALQAVPQAQGVPAIEPGERIHVGTAPWVQGVPSSAVIPGTDIPLAPAGPVQPTPGTKVNGETVDGEAFLEAGASLGGHRGVSDEVRNAAELDLAAMSYEQADRLSVRQIAKQMLKDPNQRRLAARLKQQRLDAEPPRMSAPLQEMTGTQADMISGPGRGGGFVG